VAAANLLVIGGVAGCGGRSGGVGEGDGEPERFELADVVAGFFVFAGAAGVIAGAEFAEVAVWLVSRCQMMTRMVRAMATRALSLPRRRTIRR